MECRISHQMTTNPAQHVTVHQWSGQFPKVLHQVDRHISFLNFNPYSTSIFFHLPVDLWTLSVRCCLNPLIKFPVIHFCLLWIDKVGATENTYIYIYGCRYNDRLKDKTEVSHTLGSVGDWSLKDRDEVNRREVWECEGWVCHLEDIGVSSICRLIRSVFVMIKPASPFRLTKHTVSVKETKLIWFLQ